MIVGIIAGGETFVNRFRRHEEMVAERL